MNGNRNTIVVLVMALARLHIISPVNFILHPIPLGGWVDDVHFQRQGVE